MYDVVWKPNAERQLAALWLRSRLRHQITAAADQVDAVLARAPNDAGESRDGRRRIMIQTPLVVEFDVVDDEMAVYVRAVREHPAGPIL